MKYPYPFVPEGDMRVHGMDVAAPDKEPDKEPAGDTRAKRAGYEMLLGIMRESKGFAAYVERHGWHFTDRLAMDVSVKMIPADSDGKPWTPEWNPERMAKTMEAMGHGMPEGVTVGDLVYAANMGFADLYPKALPEKIGAYKYAMALAQDPDGYEGMIFCRWVADAAAKKEEVGFEKYV